MVQYLTQSEVDELPEGTRVMIEWSGGGKALYTIGKWWNTSWTTFVNSAGERMLSQKISFVGKEKPFTRVYVPAENEH